jgi:unconventional prefoldin RPB5 interactor 1
MQATDGDGGISLAALTKQLAEIEAKLYTREQLIANLRIYHREYETLQTSLASMPDRTSHEVLVPVGSVAFMPGKVGCISCPACACHVFGMCLTGGEQLIHTNEIMVLLGDNYFAER